MTSQANHHRPFLDATKAEKAADLGALTDTLSRAVHEAEVLGLPDVRERLDAALARAVERGDGEGGRLTLTAHQVRRALALLGWKSAMLSRRSGVAYTAAMRAKTEDGIAALPFADVWAIRTALERAGVRFASDADGRPGAELRVKA